MVTRVTKAQQRAAGFESPQEFSRALTRAENQAGATTADQSQINTTGGTVGDAPTGDVIEGATQGTGFSISVPDTIPQSATAPTSAIEAERRRQQKLRDQQQQITQQLQQTRQQNQQLQQQLIEAQTPERVQNLRQQLADVQGQFVQEREALRSEPGQTKQSFEARLSPIQRQATAEEQAISGQLQAAQTAAQNRISRLQTALEFGEQERQNLINLREKVKEAAQIPSELQEASQTNAILGLVEQGVTDPSRIFDFINFNEQGEQIGSVPLDKINSVLSAVQGEDELLSVNEAAELGVPFGTTQSEAAELGITPGQGVGRGQQSGVSFEQTQQTFDEFVRNFAQTEEGRQVIDELQRQGGSRGIDPVELLKAQPEVQQEFENIGGTIEEQGGQVTGTATQDQPRFQINVGGQTIDLSTDQNVRDAVNRFGAAQFRAILEQQGFNTGTINAFLETAGEDTGGGTNNREP